MPGAKSAVNKELLGGSCVMNWKVGADTDAGDLLGFDVSWGICGASVSSPVVGGGEVSWTVGLFVYPSPSPVATYTKTVTLPGSGYATVSIPVAWEPTGSAYLLMTHTATPIGDKGQTHSKEGKVTDEWVAENVAVQITADATTGTATSSGSPGFSFTCGCAVDPDSWPDFGKYAVWVSDLCFAGEPVDLTAEVPAYDKSPAPGSYHLWEEGVGSTVGWWGDNSGGNYTISGPEVDPPFCYTFDLSAVRKLMGESIDTLEVWCTGVRQLDDDGADAGPTKKTVAEWDGLTVKQTTGFVRLR